MIHQIYCTHCTFGSSALEHREGEMAARVLGYSVRAGSLGPDELRKVYRQIERFLYYYLPSDTPTEEKLRLDARQAPRRLVYCPSIGGLQMLGQISYRAKDTAGRPGSYFGHLLVGPENGSRWSACDCLKLWGAAWVEEDSPALPFALKPLAGLESLLGATQPAIDDSVVLSFLRTPPGQAFHDPRHVIPNRWKVAPVADRRELLIDVLQGYLDFSPNRRENILLVVEPSLAALVFYGVARLLPKGGVRDEISFSTLETDAERLPVALCATTFHFPQLSELKPEVYRGRGLVLNTFSKKRSEAARSQGRYAREIVEKLVNEGWPPVDRMLARFASAGAKHPEELELLTKSQSLVPALVDPKLPLADTTWRESGIVTHYLSQTLREQFGAEPAKSSELAALVGSPRQMLVLDLIAAELESAEARAIVDLLVQDLPEVSLPELVASPRVPFDGKVAALACYFKKHARFPEPCQFLWDARATDDSLRAGPEAQLLPSVLARLPEAIVDRLYRCVSEPQYAPFFVSLVKACRLEPKMLRVVKRMIEGLDDAALCDILFEHHGELMLWYPEKDAALGARLLGMLDALPETPNEFSRRLDLLTAWVNLFPRANIAEYRLNRWNTIRGALLSLAPPAGAKGPELLNKLFAKEDGPNVQAVGKKLAEAMHQAMPGDQFPDPEGALKQAALRVIGEALLGAPDFLPTAVWANIGRYYTDPNFLWSDTGAASPAKRPQPAAKGRPASRATDRAKRSAASRRKSVLLSVLVSLVVAAVTFGALYILFPDVRLRSPSEPSKRDANAADHSGKSAASAARDAAANR